MSHKRECCYTESSSRVRCGHRVIFSIRAWLSGWCYFYTTVVQTLLVKIIKRGPAYLFDPLFLASTNTTSPTNGPCWSLNQLALAKMQFPICFQWDPLYGPAVNHNTQRCLLFFFNLHSILVPLCPKPHLVPSAIHAITEKYTTQRHRVGPAVLIMWDPPATQPSRVSAQHQW